MESWVGLGGKEGHTKIQILAEPGLNRGPSRWRAEILSTAPTMPACLWAHKFSTHFCFLYKLIKVSASLWLDTILAGFLQVENGIPYIFSHKYLAFE